LFQKPDMSAGDRLISAIRGGLPPGVELDEREQALLAAAARQADAIAALEADIAERGYVVGGKLNPAVPETRQGRTALARLLGGLDLPDSRKLTEIRAGKAAHARWHREAS
jgi:hypothetical protein